MRTEADLRDEALGIERRYLDQAGHPQAVPAETLEALRAVLAPPQDRPAAAILDPAIVVRADRPLAIPLHGSATARSVRWEITEEDGTKHRGTAPARGPSGRRQFVVPIALPLGYHRLGVDDGRRVTASELIVAPGRAFQPPVLREGRGAWGLAVQLYALRSGHDWGIGDFGDLARLVDRAAPLGAAAIGLNPLHALFPDEPQKASPYSPSSRLFLNTLYLDVEAVADFAECDEARVRAGTPEFQHSLSELRAAALVDYRGVAACKQRVLELLYRSFRTRHRANPEDGRGRAFREYQLGTGASLRRFAVYQALREARSANDPGQRSWRSWPAELRDPQSRAVGEFAEAHLERVEFHEYLQWQADLQLAAAAERGQAAGLGIGLYQDLAVGFDPDGADAWAMQDVLVPGWSIGAPPDSYNLNGQDWGLLPPDPGRLRNLAYRPFVEMLRANMRHAGALRIDHVLGLKRLFWVPHGTRPSAGAYIRYPFDDLLGLVALESVRNRCLVVGEDLGTVPKGFRKALNERGIFSYEVLYFARGRGGFRTPRQWPKDALGAVSTHDLPPLAGYWSGADIDLRDSLSLFPDKALVARDRADRKAMRQELAVALRREGLPVKGAEVPVEAVHRFLARSASRLVMAQIEDMIGQVEPVNVPGTLDQHPNWRRKLARPLEQIFDDPDILRRLSVLHEERPASRAGAALAPRATYRLQLHKGFTFRDAEAVLPYLQGIGVSHLYLSPILEAQPGSTHGYDTTSFERLNPELGGADGFEALARRLRELGLKTLVDFVPNHMGIGGATNTWWLDVLEWGPQSPYARSFDIDWQPLTMPELAGKLLVPLLGDDYDTVLAKGELALRFDAGSGSVSVWYYGSRFPIRPADYPAILGAQADGEALDTRAGADALKRRLSGLDAQALQAAPDEFARQPGALAALLDRQFYRLASWRRAGSGINYRRFFDINQLAAVRIEDPDVFARCHALIGRLIGEDKVHGLRLDHIDGLADPAAYGRRLRRFVEQKRQPSRAAFPIVVEKILAAGEELPRDWGVDGTTGYEFTNLVNGLFVDPAGARPLDRIYAKFVGHEVRFDRLLHDSKLQVIDSLFAGELKSLAALLARIAQGARRTRGWTAEQLQPVLRAVAAQFPVYRTYVSARGASAEDRRIIAGAVSAARRRGRQDAALVGFVHKALLAEIAGPRSDVLRFAQRFQQFTAPVMAKSLEDTSFYRYVRLISLNEVGGDPRVFGADVSEFHRHMAVRQEQWPHSLLATATHDTKRGEDARARLNVLSEIPGLWARRVASWRRLNRKLRSRLDGETAPSPNDEYLIYQTLLGAWPNVLVEGGQKELGERLGAYIVKATREAKWRTSWQEPDRSYEDACQRFITQLLAAAEAEPFRQDFVAFHALVSRLGALNSLCQTVLKLTVPGVPDIYQGCDLWDLSLVDPDNRRPVDFGARQRALDELMMAARDSEPGLVHELAASWPSGKIKLHVTAALLAARRAAPGLFGDGTYEPLAVRGPAAAHVLAFARRSRRQTMIVAVGRLFARLAPAADRLAPAVEAWGATSIAAPGRTEAGLFRNLLTGAVAPPPVRGRLLAADLFRAIPAAVLIAES